MIRRRRQAAAARHGDADIVSGGAVETDSADGGQWQRLRIGSSDVVAVSGCSGVPAVPVAVMQPVSSQQPGNLPERMAEAFAVQSYLGSAVQSYLGR